MKATERPGRGFVADYYFRGKRVQRSFKTAALRDAHLERARKVIDRDRLDGGLPPTFFGAHLQSTAYVLEWLTELEENIADLRRRLVHERDIRARARTRKAQ
jgi:hypothetical protein